MRLVFSMLLKTIKNGMKEIPPRFFCMIRILFVLTSLRLGRR